MDPIDKFLKLYSYKFPKGYPDMNDEQDILLLELLISEAINLKFILNEVTEEDSPNLPDNILQLKTDIQKISGFFVFVGGFAVFGLILPELHLVLRHLVGIAASSCAPSAARLW